MVKDKNFGERMKIKLVGMYFYLRGGGERAGRREGSGWRGGMMERK